MNDSNPDPENIIPNPLPVIFTQLALSLSFEISSLRELIFIFMSYRVSGPIYLRPSVLDPDPDSVANPDLDPGRQKCPTKIVKS